MYKTSLFLAAGAAALTASDPADYDGTFYNVPSADGDNTYSFTNTATFTFENAGDYTALPKGLHSSDNDVLDREHNEHATYDHTFTPANVNIDPPYLTLTVPGGQAGNTEKISSAEVVTDEALAYASVRTIATWSSEPGTINALFFYRTDQDEIDIEYATNSSAITNQGDAALAAKAEAPEGSDGRTLPVLQFTNQKHTEDSPESTADHFYPGPDGSEHEFRIDWTPGRSDFYLDGDHVGLLTDNVPSVATYFTLNNWANGDPGFSYGPPNGDNVFKIRQIVMYYNTTNEA